MSKHHSRSNLALLTMLGTTLACSNPGEGGEQGVGTVSSGSTSAATTATSDLPSTGSTTEQSSTSGSSDDASSVSDTTCIGCPADLPQLGSCSIWDNDCPVGYKCNIWANDGGSSWNASKCVPLGPDPAGADEPCTTQESAASGLDNCDVSTVCRVDDLEALTGLCQPLCVGSEAEPTCEDSARSCVRPSDGYGFCHVRCNPLEADACAPSQGCYPGYPDPLCFPDGSGPKLGAAFDPCAFNNACDPGLLCVSTEGVGACDEGEERCCTPWCDLDAPDCPEPTTCQPGYTDRNVPVGLDSVGFCGQEPS